MRWTGFLGLVVLAALVLGGCNTIHGIGKDIQQGGKAIQRSAKQ